MKKFLKSIILSAIGGVSSYYTDSVYGVAVVPIVDLLQRWISQKIFK